MKALSVFTIILLALTCGIYTVAYSSNCISCRIWSKIPIHGEYLLENNRWGDHHADVCIFDNGYEFGWFWHKRFPSRHPIYPEMIFGWKPWLDHSTTDKLPKKIGEIQALILEVNYSTTADKYSHYNVLVDVWITRSNPPSPDKITDEVGIYLETHGIWVERQKSKSLRRGYELVEINGTSFIYVRGESFSWRLHKFYLAGEKPEKIDIMALIKYLGLSGDLYVASVEFGNEVWMGKGLTIVRGFRVEVVLDDPQP